MSDSPTKALNDLLSDLFTASELRAFLRHGDDGNRVRNALPAEGATLDELAFAAVDALDKRGLIHDGLFGRLIKERPAKTQQILAVWERWGGPGYSAPAPASPMARTSVLLPVGAGLLVIGALVGGVVSWTMAQGPDSYALGECVDSLEGLDVLASQKNPSREALQSAAKLHYSACDPVLRSIGGR